MRGSRTTRFARRAGSRDPKTQGGSPEEPAGLGLASVHPVDAAEPFLAVSPDLLGIAAPSSVARAGGTASGRLFQRPHRPVFPTPFSTSCGPLRNSPPSTHPSSAYGCIAEGQQQGRKVRRECPRPVPKRKSFPQHLRSQRTCMFGPISPSIRARAVCNADRGHPSSTHAVDPVATRLGRLVALTPHRPLHRGPNCPASVSSYLLKRFGATRSWAEPTTLVSPSVAHAVERSSVLIQHDFVITCTP